MKDGGFLGGIYGMAFIGAAVYPNFTLSNAKTLDN